MHNTCIKDGLGSPSALVKGQISDTPATVGNGGNMKEPMCCLADAGAELLLFDIDSKQLPNRSQRASVA